MFDLLVMMLAGLTVFFASGAESAPCPSGTVGVNVTSEADIHRLTHVLNCTGQGSFDVRWYSSLTLAHRIEVSDAKNVTIRGSASPTIRGGIIDAGKGDGGTVIDRENATTGIFSVSDGSTLRLSHLVLAGGREKNGGAVDLVSSSNLFLVDCAFLNNNASKGGKTRRKVNKLRIGRGL